MLKVLEWYVKKHPQLINAVQLFHQGNTSFIKVRGEHSEHFSANKGVR